MTVGTSSDIDYQEDLFAKATTPGTYVVEVSQGQVFSSSDASYQLFIDVQP
jgi:hypothetical protein